MKIKTSLTLWFTILVSTLMFISNAIVLFAVKEYLYNQKVDEIKERVVQVEKVINALAIDKKESKEKFDIKDPELLLYTLTDQHTTLYEGAYLQVTSLNDQIFSKSPTLEKSELPVLKDGTIGTLTLDLPTKKGKTKTKILYYSTTLAFENILLAKLQIGLPLAKNDKLVSELLFFRLIEISIAIFISILFGIFLSKRALSPMVKITDEVNSMEGKNLLKLLDTKNLDNDEIGNLAKTFNSLLSRISEAFEFQKRFVSDASHELRSPLTTIKGYAQLIAKRGSEKPEIAKEGLDVIIQEVERLERMVNDMLTLAKTGRNTTDFRKVDIIALINSLFDQLHKIHANLKIDSSNERIFVKADEDSLTRVFINLIDNALRVTEKTGFVKISWKVEDSYIFISISDNGIGMDKEHLEHIFERFYRVDSSREREKGGSGLGLALVKDITLMHNGQVFVESKKGEGSTFTVKLPIFI